MATKEQLTKIRVYLVDEIFRNPDLVHDENVRGVTDECDKCKSGGYKECSKCDKSNPDLLGVIAHLYNLLHEYVEGERYEYFFHWINKVGGWVDDNYLDYIMNKEDKQNE